MAKIFGQFWVIFSSVLCCWLSYGEEPPNIIWISCEDISAHFGCYGDPHAITPNIDQLAAEGVRYTHAFTASGVCAPCRSTIITGMYQNSIGTHHMRCNAKLPGWLKPFPLYLREAGYYCTNNSKTDYQFSKPSKTQIWDSSSSKAHWKNKKKDQPFFAVFNFTGCHESGIESESKWKKVSSVLTKEQRQDPALFTNIPPYYPDTPVVREDWKRNYENITAMDYWAGALIKELKQAGEYENTIIFFWSDHGVGLPRAKRWLYDSGTRIPLVVRVPEKYRVKEQATPGLVSDELINSTDFGATVLNLAGLSVPEHIQGQAFLGEDIPNSRECVYGARDRMDERYDIIRTVRDKNYRYIRNFEPLKPYYQYMNTPEKGATMQAIRAAEKAGTLTKAQQLFSAKRKPVEELYDIENDPHEVSNLATDPVHSERIAKMRQQLADWQFKIGDIGLLPESEIERREGSCESTYAILRQSKDGGKQLITELVTIATKASDETALPDLVTALDDQEPAIRYWGATGLGNFADKAKADQLAITKLDGLLNDKIPAVRIAAARALCRMGQTDKALPLLGDELAGMLEWARLEASIALDYLDEVARPVLPHLKRALKDQPNKYIIRVANRAVNDLDNTENKVR